MSILSPKVQKRLLTTIIIVSGLFITLKLTYWYQFQTGENRIFKQSQQQLSELVTFLDSVLSRYENIPHVLSDNPLLTEVLREQEDQAKVNKLNLYFEELKRVTEASDIYLINVLGIAISASNWQQDYSFIGQDYSFRPYYTEAISGRLGSYYAVGTSSDKRCFYFSYPIDEGKTILGAVVIKVDITDVEQQATGLASAGQYEFLITDPDDIVFISSVKEWQLASLKPLNQAKQYAINASKRYANRPLSELIIEPEYRNLPENEYAIYRINSAQGNAKYMDSHALMEKAKWRVHILAPLKPFYASLPYTLLLSACLYLLLALGIMFSIERRRNLHRMKVAHDLLELRVKERTQDLQAANNKLKDTQDELIQAAKLTVIGTLSASINHELNQPLAALRSYAQNTQTFLSRDMIEKASDNIRIMIELTDRLADIIGQFKSFTRKSQGTENATDIRQCIEQSLTIVQPEIDKQGIALTLVLPEMHYEIWGDSVRLQQVLVNIISNAIVAMQQSVTKQLRIEVSSDTKVCISIQDSGPGVREGQMEKIFEPYFTTNERQGLGLGLSISQRIIESMQGTISVSNAPEGGAIFKLVLPIYLAEERSTL